MINNGNLVADFRLVHIVRCHEDGHVLLLLHRADVVPDICPRLRIQSGCRFIQKKYFREMHQSPGNFHTPLHAAGETLHHRLLPIQKANQVKSKTDALPDFLFGNVVKITVQSQIFFHRQITIECRFLKDNADIPADFCLLGIDIMSGNLQRTTCFLKNGAQRVDCCCLSRPVRPQESKDGSFVHIKGDIVDRELIAVGFCEITNFNDF